MTAKIVLRWLLAVGMVIAGVLHFVRPDGYLQMMPQALPAPLMLVYVSGVFESLGGLGLLVPKTRSFSGWGLIALYLAIFPANVNMAVHHLPFGGHEVAPWMLWARLPLQLVLIVWAYWVSRPDVAKPVVAA